MTHFVLSEWHGDLTRERLQAPAGNGTCVSASGLLFGLGTLVNMFRDRVQLPESFQEIEVHEVLVHLCSDVFVLCACVSSVRSTSQMFILNAVSVYDPSRCFSLQSASQPSCTQRCKR